MSHITRQKETSIVSELTSQNNGPLPVWVRAPSRGVERFTGFSRAKLYELSADKSIRSVSIRKPGQVKGTRLFNLQSILDFVSRCETGGVS
jgi:hypothetical protein